MLVVYFALTSVEFHYEHLQLVKCCLLENSNDDTVRAIYKLRKERVSDFTKRSQETGTIEHNCCFAGQTDRAGLGSQKSSYVATRL